jgi:hypothetical protein
MATSKIRGLDEQLLEGGGGGGGMGRGSSIKGTKWSGMPSFKGNSSTMGDIKKLTADSSHLKGGAKKAVEEAKNRAAKRTAVRAGVADAAYEGGKAIVGDSVSAKDSGSKDDGTVEASFRSIKEESPEVGEMATHYKPDNYKSGGKVNASRRADGIAQRGKTRGKVC